jgi:rfaE bifunctional protein kinase chain/domain
MSDTPSRAEYEALVRRMEGRSVLVLGDLMVDEYVQGRALRVSPESPVLVVEVQSEDSKPGGAANVVNNVLAMSARSHVYGVVGRDEAGERLTSGLAAAGADVSGIVIDPTRPTTRKTRVVAQEQQVVRIDREDVSPIDGETERAMLAQIASRLPNVDAVLLSDYRKGMITPTLARRVCAMALEAGKPLVANPKPASARWLENARLLSVNQVEAEQLGGSPLPEQADALAEYGWRLLSELQLRTLVITRGSKGLAYWTRDIEHRTVPAHAVEVYDIAGAGDTTIAAMTLALAAGATDFAAACVANHAGACVVRKRGVAVVTLEELIDDWNC